MEKTLLRVLFSPIIFVMHLAVVIGGIIFPTTIITLMSLIQFFQFIFCGFINLSLNTKIVLDPSDTFIQHFNNKYLNCIAGMTILIWFPFYSVYVYIIEGKIWIMGLK